MGAEPQRGLTLILGRARAGDERARGELVALVYDVRRRAPDAPGATIPSPRCTRRARTATLLPGGREALGRTP